MESSGPKVALGLWEVEPREGEHEDGENTLRPGFLVTDGPPHATVTVPTRRGSKGSQKEGLTWGRIAALSSRAHFYCLAH